MSNINLINAIRGIVEQLLVEKGVVTLSQVEALVERKLAEAFGAPSPIDNAPSSSTTAPATSASYPTEVPPEVETAPPTPLAASDARYTARRMTEEEKRKKRADYQREYRARRAAGGPVAPRTRRSSSPTGTPAGANASGSTGGGAPVGAPSAPATPTPTPPVVSSKTGIAYVPSVSLDGV